MEDFGVDGAVAEEDFAEAATGWARDDVEEGDGPGMTAVFVKEVGAEGEGGGVGGGSEAEADGGEACGCSG